MLSIFLFKIGLFSRTPPPPIFRTVIENNDAPHKQTINRETNNNITEDTDIWRKRKNNRIKYSHVKEEISTIPASIEGGAYCTAAGCLLPPVNICVFYCSQRSLLLTTFSIISTWFAVLIQIIIILKHCQLALLIDYDLTPELTNTYLY